MMLENRISLCWRLIALTWMALCSACDTSESEDVSFDTATFSDTGGYIDSDTETESVLDTGSGDEVDSESDGYEEETDLSVRTTIPTTISPADP